MTHSLTPTADSPRVEELLEQIDAMLPALPHQMARVLAALRERRVADTAELARLRTQRQAAATVLLAARDRAQADVDNITAWLKHAGLE